MKPSLFKIAMLSTAVSIVLAGSASAAPTATGTGTLTVTAPVAASLTFTRIEDASVPGTPVTAFALPETAGGATSAASANYRVVATSSAKWDVSGAITTAFTAAASGATLPNSAILANTVSAPTTFSPFGAGSFPLQTGVAKASTTSGNFGFKFSPASGADSGTYSGVITVTATTE
ncbi:MAG: hypothetical protein JWN41_1670 [Thermoleophilia bacterium]|nr:hypothetical protein [Thermoleophilia bacterium]